MNSLNLLSDFTIGMHHVICHWLMTFHSFWHCPFQWLFFACFSLSWRSAFSFRLTGWFFLVWACPTLRWAFGCWTSYLCSILFGWDFRFFILVLMAFRIFIASCVSLILFYQPDGRLSVTSNFHLSFVIRRSRHSILLWTFWRWLFVFLV